MSKTYDLVGIGNAIVDVIAHGDDPFLADMGIEKGIMQLIDRDRAETLYGAMQDRVQTAGGSVANTIAGAASLGLATAFLGKVKDDDLGQFYVAGMRADGSDFPNPPVADAALAPTSRSMIFVSPDGERSMNTYLGAGADFNQTDVDVETAKAARWMFLEGYLYDKPEGKSAFTLAGQACRAGGGKVGITLSDPFCVDRHRDDFRQLIAQGMDFTIGNHEEWLSLYQTTDLEAALRSAAEVCDLVVCTHSGAPVKVIHQGTRTEVAVRPVTPVDATGAGDQFAAGFLGGMAMDLGITRAGEMGVAAAAEVIAHIGPRPKRSLRAVLTEKGLM